MKNENRPPFIRNWRDIEEPDNAHYPDSDELLSIGAPLGRQLGLTRIGIHHERIPPGRRTSYPHAESSEEEFAYVISGTPNVWINGHLYPLGPGDAVAFPAGTGICHTFINDSDSEVHLLVIGETDKGGNLIHYPLDVAYERTRDDRWINPPYQTQGPHNGKPSGS